MQFSIILAMILYRQLQREMGLKLLKDEGELDFGVRAMKVVLTTFYKVLEVQHYSTTLNRSSPKSS